MDADDAGAPDRVTPNTLQKFRGESGYCSAEQMRVVAVVAVDFPRGDLRYAAV